jgi:hypothetical protein
VNTGKSRAVNAIAGNASDSLCRRHHKEMRVASELEKLYELSFYKDRTREWISIELVKGMVHGQDARDRQDAPRRPAALKRGQTPRLRV